MKSASAWRSAMPWLLLLLVTLAATGLRFGVIESSAIGQQCGGSHAPGWCVLRQWLVLGFLHNVYGGAALLATAAAFVSGRIWLAWLAAALGAFALVLYGFVAGALALLLGCLRLLRLQAARVAPVEQHRPRHQQINAEP